MRLTHLGLCVSLCLTPAAAFAGPLSPPPGPVAPTMKSLHEIDPRIPVGPATTLPTDAGPITSVYTITQPGTYTLTGHLTGQPGRFTIWIAASDVTLDLNGFSLSGGAGGIIAGTLQGPVRGVVVRNGAVRDAETAGVTLSGVEGGRLENMTVSGCGGVGLRIGAGGVMLNCTAVANERGFDVDGGASATNCKAVNNQDRGFNTAAGTGATFTNCTATGNGGIGFGASGAVLTDCTASENGDTGFHLLAASVARGCRAYCNTQAGFAAYSGGLLDRCVAAENGLRGFYATMGVRIEGCTASANGGDGIQVDQHCDVVNNTTRGNGTAQGLTGAGVRCIGSGNRVEGNLVVHNEVGVACASTAMDNFIVRNVARGNTISGITAPAGNEMAPVITNPGSNNFSTATPWSNFVN